MSKFLEVRRVAVTGSFVAAVAATWALAGAALAGPTPGSAPSISPTTPREGQPVAGTKGTWTDASGTPTIHDQWESCINGTCSPVGTVDNLSYTPQASDVGHTIVLRETATDAALTPPSTTVDSAATAAVLPLPPAPALGAPSVLGSATPQPGQTLTAVHGGWSPSPATVATTFTDVWERCVGSTCTSTGVTGPTYLLGPGDVGSTLEFVETATNAGGTSSTSEKSTPSPTVLPLPPANLTLPSITGTPQQGQVLTMTPGTWSNNPTLAEQWEDCAGLICTPIPGQTGTSYTVGAGDVGHTIQVVETASNLAPPPTNVVAAPSATTATASAISATSVVAFSQNTPSTNQVVTLVATISSGSGNANPHGSLSFFNGSNAISGCANKGVNGGQTITIVCQASFAAGQAQISAAYLADPTSLVLGSSSDTTSVDVGKGSTSISLAVTPQVAPGGRATYVATLGVPVSNGGPILPSGPIEFLDGGQPIGTCANQPLSNLTATCSVRYPSAGAHSITARYGGDDNFTGSTSSASGVQIVKGAPKAPAVRGTLGSTLGWKIGFHPHYSELIGLEAFAVARGTSIVIQCHGKGCPFTTWRPKTGVGSVNLMRRFRHRHLRAGTRITIRLIRRHWFGKYYSITIRAGRPPKVTHTCLAPGGVKPGVGCTST